MKTIKQIITDHLKSIGADGLCCTGCGCGIDDLFPCDCTPIYCRPAKAEKFDPELHGDIPEGEFEKGDTIFIEMKDGK
jgi:hypothetical protein